MELLTRLADIRAKIDAAARAAGRDPAEITLEAATKTQTDETIRTAVAAGITVCGENRVQELTAHLDTNAYGSAQVHFIGHLQTNKVKYVVGRVDLIESVDSDRLLSAIAQRAAKMDLVQDILLEVNIAREASKSGLMPEQVIPLALAAAAEPHVRLRGLMCIPPAGAETALLRTFFAETRQLLVDLRKKIGDNNSNVDCLSMGMSSDFPLAVEEGATLVRVGSALFGPRPAAQHTT